MHAESDVMHRLEKAAEELRRGTASTNGAQQRPEIIPLRVELASLTMIGQATGMLMERFGRSPGEAEAMLRILAEEAGCDVETMAQRFVDAGRVDDVR